VSNPELDSARPNLPLLVFQYGEASFVIRAEKVETVIQWREPVPLPHSRYQLAGVIQDRGRVVAVLSHPSGAEGASSGSERPSRILVCRTSQGHIGIPADTTQSIGQVTVDSLPASGAVVDTAAGPMTYVDPEHIASSVTGAAAGAPKLKP
jgi:chemotaxis signal transduction protein